MLYFEFDMLNSDIRTIERAVMLSVSLPVVFGLFLPIFLGGDMRGF